MQSDGGELNKLQSKLVSRFLQCIVFAGREKRKDEKPKNGNHPTVDPSVLATPSMTATLPATCKIPSRWRLLQSLAELLAAAA